MSDYSFLSDAGIKIKEIEPSGSHTAAQSKEKGPTDARIENPPAAARLEKELSDHGFSIKSLDLEVEKETVRISGKVKDQETREKVILTVGNVQGISRVEESISVEKKAPESVFHTVERADSLESIAEKMLGDPSKWEIILAANAPMLRLKKEIYPGMVLRIPLEEVKKKP